MIREIDPKRYLAPGTSLHTFIGWLVFLFSVPILFVLSLLSTWGLALIAWIIALVFFWLRQARAQARLKGSAILVGPDQFPEIHAAASRISKLLQIHEPNLYILESNDQNAFAITHGSKHNVVLVDDIVHGALATGNSRVLEFIIAHELAHHALGHTGLIRSRISTLYRPLSRLDEFSCDAVAHAIVQDGTAVRDAMTLLLVGPQLFARVNKVALDQQARQVVADKHSQKSESGLSHPLLLRRYARLVAADSVETLPARPLPQQIHPVPQSQTLQTPQNSSSATPGDQTRWAPPPSQSPSP